MDINNELARIQKELKAPKGQFNSFGKYKYRSCEDILESVKPLLNHCFLTITDEVVMIGNRYYVKAVAKIQLGLESVSTHAFAREAERKKGQDESQITGSASSYARKYALNGLFCIDDTKDADTMDNTKSVEPDLKGMRNKVVNSIAEIITTADADKRDGIRNSLLGTLKIQSANDVLNEKSASKLTAMLQTVLKFKEGLK